MGARRAAINPSGKPDRFWEGFVCPVSALAKKPPASRRGPFDQKYPDADFPIRVAGMDQAAADTWPLAGTDAIVFRICEAIW